MAAAMGTSRATAGSAEAQARASSEASASSRRACGAATCVDAGAEDAGIAEVADEASGDWWMNVDAAAAEAGAQGSNNALPAAAKGTGSADQPSSYKRDASKAPCPAKLTQSPPSPRSRHAISTGHRSTAPVAPRCLRMREADVGMRTS